MAQNSSRAIGRHFLHIPGPTPLPDRVLRAMDTPIIDHRGPEFAKLAKKRARRHQDDLQDHQSGHHLHRDRHRRLGSRAGQHAVARRPRADGRNRPVRHAVEEHGGASSACKPEFITTDWRHGADPKAIEAKLREDKNKEIKAVCVLHNETSTGACRRSPRSARRSTRPAIRRCCWSTPSPRSPRPTTATTNGASMSPSAARRRA